MTMNRREMLVGAACTTTGTLVFSPGVRADDFSERKRLQLPKLLDARTTGRFGLTAMAGSVNFTGRATSKTYGFNQDYLGPTLRIANGTVQAKIQNTLNEAISVHWHGLLLPGIQDGGPHQEIAQGQSWQPQLDISQVSSTAWYHTHIHQHTARQVYNGLAGAIQVTDGRDRDRGLPDAYGENDLLLVLQDKRIDDAGRMSYRPQMMDLMHGFVGDQILVNGQSDGLAVVPRGIVRLRLLNASNARIFTLFLEDGRPMHMIATDGGYLSNPVAIQQLRLSPGERVEVLVDFGNGGSTSLKSAEDANLGSGGMMGRMSRMTDAFWDRSFVVLPFSVDDRLKSPIDRVPDQIDSTVPALEGKGVKQRRISLDMAMGPGMM